jgi:hypothetical protein
MGVVALGAALYFLLPGEPSRPPQPVETTERPGPQAPPAATGQFRADLEALGIAADRYSERARDFDAGRIGCNLLIPGYVAADDAYVRVAASYRNLGFQSNSATVAAYDSAGGHMAEVNNHFDESGCPRP